jgi:hypothetical protein
MNVLLHETGFSLAGVFKENDKSLPTGSHPYHIFNDHLGILTINLKGTWVQEEQ